MMLKHMRLSEQAANIEQAVFKTLAEGQYLTADLGGRATNSEYTKAVISVSWNMNRKWFMTLSNIFFFIIRTWNK